MTDERIRAFRRIVWRHWRLAGRNLPWRRTTNPYRILVSEIMLQQTQVSRVASKYREFLRRFPTFAALKRAPTREILAAWQGLGYNRRALALKKIAETITEEYGGNLPQDPDKLLRLPGIGNATAGSIAAFAFNRPAIFIETNIRRAFIHFFFPRRKRVSDEEILVLVKRTLPPKRIREWYWALMDYGSILGTTLGASKAGNPNRKSSRYRRQSAFKGSFRQLRGKIVRLLIRKTSRTKFEIAVSVGAPLRRVGYALDELRREGFVKRKGRRFML